MYAILQSCSQGLLTLPKRCSQKPLIFTGVKYNRQSVTQELYYCL